MKSVLLISIAMLGLVNVACDDTPGGVAIISSASSIAPSGRISPDPIALSPLTPCTGGFAFGTSFHLVVTAGANDLRLESVTVHLLDGTNVGGPSVSIPAAEFATQSASTFIHAGTTRDFSLRPAFGCFTGRPLFMRGNALLFDPQGIPHTVGIGGRVQ